MYDPIPRRNESWRSAGKFRPWFTGIVSASLDSHPPGAEPRRINVEPPNIPGYKSGDPHATMLSQQNRAFITVYRTENPTKQGLIRELIRSIIGR